jgi:hypothetical protein
MKTKRFTRATSFWRKGVAVVPEFLCAAECENLLSAVTDYRHTHELPVIYREENERSLNYMVLEAIPPRSLQPREPSSLSTVTRACTVSDPCEERNIA